MQASLSAANSPQSRNATLDSLRGIAIFLMVVDHIANFWFETRIEWDSIRLPTRLSMPLFAILMGYFISTNRPFPWRRMFQVAAVSGIVNVFFYPLYERVEILASLLVCYVLVFSTSKYASLLTLALFLLPWDPSAQVFDYPLTLVAGCVAQGQVLRHYGWKIALVVSVILCFSAIYIDPVAKMTVLMIPVATGLIIWAIRYPNKDVPGLSLMGRYPLAMYLAHYLMVLWFRPQ
jgi:uncharacterized membrane protein